MAASVNGVQRRQVTDPKAPNAPGVGVDDFELDPRWVRDQLAAARNPPSQGIDEPAEGIELLAFLRVQERPGAFACAGEQVLEFAVGGRRCSTAEAGTEASGRSLCFARGGFIDGVAHIFLAVPATRNRMSAHYREYVNYGRAIGAIMSVTLFLPGFSVRGLIGVIPYAVRIVDYFLKKIGNFDQVSGKEG